MNFDPTVFDNLKVVIEGEIYDYDLEGHIQVVDRIDSIDLAKMNRSYEITFKTKDALTDINAYIRLKVDILNLSLELMNGSVGTRTPGCRIEVGFHTAVSSTDQCSTIKQILTNVWGKDRLITQTLSFIYSKEQEYFQNHINIDFQRYIYEDQVDDLLEMITAIFASLQKLEDELK